LTGAGPPAKRWAKRTSAQRIIDGPNTTLKPRYTAARPWIRLASAPREMSITVATSTTTSTTGVAASSTTPVRLSFSGYRATRPATMKTQKPISPATITPAIGFSEMKSMIWPMPRACRADTPWRVGEEHDKVVISS
jgi:hypothetical protein